jgi:hypothetical protein
MANGHQLVLEFFVVVNSLLGSNVANIDGVDKKSWRGWTSGSRITPHSAKKTAITIWNQIHARENEGVRAEVMLLMHDLTQNYELKVPAQWNRSTFGAFFHILVSNKSVKPKGASDDQNLGLPAEPVETLEQQWKQFLLTAKSEGIGEQDCRRLLGIVATAREAINWSSIEALLLAGIQSDPASPSSVLGLGDAVRVLKPDRLLDTGYSILRFAQPFFRRGGRGVADNEPLAFPTATRDHILSLLPTTERTFCEILFAQGCVDWRRTPLTEYALHHRFTHLLQIPKWCIPLSRAFADIEFVERCDSMVIAEAARKAGARAFHSASLFEEWAGPFGEWSDFLEKRETASATGWSYAEELVNEFLPALDGKPFPPGRLRSELSKIDPLATATIPFFLRKVRGPSTDITESERPPPVVPAYRGRVVRIACEPPQMFKIIERDAPWVILHDLPPAEDEGHASTAQSDLCGLPPGLYKDKCVAISVDGKYVAAGRPGQNVVVMDGETNKRRVLYFAKNIETVALIGSRILQLVVTDGVGGKWIYDVLTRESIGRARGKKDRTAAP